MEENDSWKKSQKRFLNEQPAFRFFQGHYRIVYKGELRVAEQRFMNEGSKQGLLDRKRTAEILREGDVSQDLLDAIADLIDPDNAKFFQPRKMIFKMARAGKPSNPNVQMEIAHEIHNTFRIAHSLQNACDLVSEKTKISSEEINKIWQKHKSNFPCFEKHKLEMRSRRKK